MKKKHFTTMTEVRTAVSENGAVIRFGNRVFAIDGNENDGYEAQVYTRPDFPNDFSYPESQRRLRRIAVSAERFEDTGHAFEWCRRQR